MAKAKWVSEETPVVGNESHSANDYLKLVGQRIEELDDIKYDGDVLGNYKLLRKVLSTKTYTAERGERLIKDNIAEDYESILSSVPKTVYESSESIIGFYMVSRLVTEDDKEHVCPKNVLNSPAFKRDPILTGIAGASGIVYSSLLYVTKEASRFEHLLDQAIEKARQGKLSEFAGEVESFKKAHSFDFWGYTNKHDLSLEQHDGLAVMESLLTTFPSKIDTIESKLATLVKINGEDASVLDVARLVLYVVTGVSYFYQHADQAIRGALRVLQKVAKEAFADFASESQQVTDFANRYRDEHMLDEPYHKINIDAKGNISHQAWLTEKGIGNMYEHVDDVPVLDFVALESEDGENKSLIARLIEKIKQFFIWLAKKVGIYREKEEKVDIGDIKKKHDDVEDKVRKCRSDVADIKDFKESLKSEAIAKLRNSTEDQKLACYLLDTHYKQANKDTLANVFNNARIWNINPVAAAGLAIIGPYQTVKHYPVISEAIKSLEVIIDSLVKAADTVASNGNGANITALSRLPKVDIDVLQSMRQTLSKVYSLENIKDVDSDIVKDKDTELVLSDISNFDTLINKFDSAVEHVTVTLNRLNGNAVKNNDIELEEIGKWLNYTATLFANMISIFNGYRQAFQHQWGWLRRYEQLLVVKRKPATEGWASAATQEVHEEDLGMNELLDMESDTEDFDIEMDNETLGVDDLEDYVSNDIEPAQTDVAVGLEHYGELIASKGMCKEYYVACESLQPGIFSGIQQNRLTALPSRTMQAVALEAVEGEQKKSLIARLIEKIKQFFKWILSKLGIGVGTVKGKDANGKEVEVEYDSASHQEAMDELASEISHQSTSVSEESKSDENTQFNMLKATTAAQKIAKRILIRTYKKGFDLKLVKTLSKSPAWSKNPIEAVGLILVGPCYTVSDNDYIDRGIASIEEHMALIMKVSNMIKDGTIGKWDSTEALEVIRVEDQKLYNESKVAVQRITEEDLGSFVGGILGNRYVAKVGKSIEKYAKYSKELKEKLARTNEAFEHISASPETATDIVLNSVNQLFALTMHTLNSVNNLVRQHTHALIMQERWIRRVSKLVKIDKERPATESFIGWAQPAPVSQSWCIPAMEAIDFQYKSKLFTRLTKWCAELRMAKNFTSKALAESDIGKIIEEETNLQFIFKIDSEQDANAAVLTVQLDRNNPIYTNFLHNFLDNDELLRAKSLLGNTIEGLIDYQKGKVGGVFAKVKNTMWLTVGLVKSKLLTDEEVAAVICHEIGHTFTIFSQIASIVSLNYIIDDLSKRVLGTNDRKVQISILHEYDTKYGIKLPEDEILATTDNKQKFVTKVVTDVVKRSRNVEGDYVFSMRNCELAADQFAARMGAGRHIVSGLNKMYATWGHMQYQSKGVHYTIQAFTVLATALLSTAGIIINPLLPILIIFGLVMDRPQEKVYDEPMQRFTRIRNEYIAALKQVGLSREMKSVYLDDIQAMDKIINAMNKNIGWLEWVWVNWIPSGKRTAKAEAYQQLIERMGNNDLFMKSASYELLIEDLKNA